MVLLTTVKQTRATMATFPKTKKLRTATATNAKRKFISSSRYITTNCV